jgi:hypothetical protein
VASERGGAELVGDWGEKLTHGTGEREGSLASGPATACGPCGGDSTRSTGGSQKD